MLGNLLLVGYLLCVSALPVEGASRDGERSKGRHSGIESKPRPPSLTKSSTPGLLVPEPPSIRTAGSKHQKSEKLTGKGDGKVTEREQRPPSTVHQETTYPYIVIDDSSEEKDAPESKAPKGVEGMLDEGKNAGYVKNSSCQGGDAAVREKSKATRSQKNQSTSPVCNEETLNPESDVSKLNSSHDARARTVNYVGPLPPTSKSPIKSTKAPSSTSAVSRAPLVSAAIDTEVGRSYSTEPIEFFITIPTGYTCTEEYFACFSRDILAEMSKYVPEQMMHLPRISKKPETDQFRQFPVSDMVALLRGLRVNDSIMNAYMQYLVFMSSSLSSAKMMQERKDNPTFMAIDSLWINKVAKKKLDIKGKSTILWPLFHSHQLEELNHWTLLEVHIDPSYKQRESTSSGSYLTLRHYDSISGPLDSLVGLPSALNYFSNQFETELTIHDVAPQPTPQQSNNRDCGVFVLGVAKRLILGISEEKMTPMNPDLLRAQIAVELLGKKIMVPT